MSGGKGVKKSRKLITLYVNEPLRSKFSSESIPKVLSKNFENLLCYLNFNEINNVKIANRNTGNFVHFW